MEASVAEIHAYPARPEGFEEPLFPTRGSRLAVADHLLEAPWLSRASELVAHAGARPGPGHEGRTAHVFREPVEVQRRRGRLWVGRGLGRVRARGAWVVEKLDRWREVGRWWDEGACADRLVLRVLLSDEAVVDLARERPGGWFLVGVED